MKKEKVISKKETIKVKGITYEKLPNGKVKKVTSLADIKKLDLDKAVKEDYSKMTVQLFRYMKDKVVNVIYKNKMVYYKAFKMWYAETGFKLIDEKNYGKEVKTPFKGLPTAEEAFTFVDSIKGVDKKAIKIKKDKEKEKVNLLLNKIKDLASGKVVITELNVRRNYSVFIKDASISDDVREHYSRLMIKKFPYLTPKEELDLNAMRKKAVMVVKRNKTNGDTICEKVDAMIPHRSFRVLFRKLIRQFKGKKMRLIKLVNETIELLENDNVFVERRVPEGKFIVKPTCQIDEIIETCENTVTYRNSTGDYKFNKSEIIARDLLYVMPEVQVQMANYLRGKITKEQFINEPVVRDRFICLDYSEIKPMNNELKEICEELMLLNNIAGTLDILYKSDREFNIGDKVKVVFPCQFHVEYGTIHKYEHGWKVRYDNMDVDYLYNCLKITVIK